MANTAASVPPVKQRQGRARYNNPYQTGTGTDGPRGPSWTVFNTVVTIGLGIIITLIGIVYVNVKEEIKGVREEGKETRTIQAQSNRDMTELRVTMTKIGSQLDNVLQRVSVPPK